MIQHSVQTTLSRIATEIMRDNVESIAICCLTKDSQILSIYDMDEGASVFELIGAVSVLAQRIAIGGVEMPELFDDEDED